jgi:putative tryptophan/tyrosine transport system substrate-binding protein
MRSRIGESAMKRREFIGLIGGTAVLPLTARAQQRTVPVIGFFGAGSPDPFADRLAAFRDGLRRVGFVEGRNVVIEFRWAETGYDQLPAVAAELVDRQVDVLVTGNAAAAAKSATTTIPLVCLFGGDPVNSGLVASLNKPGSNLTGVSLFAFSLGAKRLELLHELVPNKLIAVVANPSQPDPGSKTDMKEVASAARVMGQQIIIFNVSKDQDFEPACAAMIQHGAGGLLVMADPYLNNRRDRIVEFAARNAIPAIFEWREAAVAGGLMSYGSSLTDAFRQLGAYTGQVLNGAKPADLPVMQAVKVELVLNLKTAKMLGLTFPLALLARADEVIE